MVGLSTAMAGASCGVMFNTLKPLTNGQTVRGRPTPNVDDERTFRRGSFCELLANISNVAIKFSQVQKYVQTMSRSQKYINEGFAFNKAFLYSR